MGPNGTANWRALGTYVHLSTSQAMALEPARQIASQLLAEVDRTCSRFRPDSDLVRANSRAGSWTDVDPLLVQAIAAAIEAAAETDGLVDPTLGHAMAAIGYDRDVALVLSASTDPAAIPVAARAGAWREILLDPAGAVMVPPGCALDLGATAKAWAADLIASSVVAQCDSTVVISLGGDVAVANPGTLTNDTRGRQDSTEARGTARRETTGARGLDSRETRDARGTDTRDARGTDTRDARGTDTRDARGTDTREARDARGTDTRDARVTDTREARDARGSDTRDARGPGWPVAISETIDDRAGAEIVHLPYGGLATSSTAARRWVRGDVIRHHLLDPRSGEPTAGPWRTVTATGATCVAANTASTAAIVLGELAVRWLTERDIPARLVDVTGKIVRTDRWPEPEETS